MCWQIFLVENFDSLSSWLMSLTDSKYQHHDMIHVFMVLVRQMYISSLLQQDRGFKYRSMSLSQRFYKMLAVGVLASSCGLEKYKQEYIEQIVGSLEALASCPLTKGETFAWADWSSDDWQDTATL